MRLRPIALVLALVAVPLAGAHEWNFENKGELCGVAPGDYSPHGHGVADGHAHWHHTGPAEQAHVHWDPATQTDVLHPVGHTHSTILHDPCLQTRMDYPEYLAIAQVPLAEVGPPASAIDPLATLYPATEADHSRIYASGEAYEFPLPVSAWKRQANLVVASDLQAAGMGFPGDGSRDNPYVIEGYIIEGNLVVKNTSQCYVVRNNVVVNRVIGPQPPIDLEDIVSLRPLVAAWEETIATAQALRDEVQAEKQVRDAGMARMQAQWRELEAERATYRAQAAAWAKAQVVWDALVAEYGEGLDLVPADVAQLLPLPAPSAAQGSGEMVVLTSPLDEPEFADFRAAKSAFEQEHAAFLAERAAFIADFAQAKADHRQFLVHRAGVLRETQEEMDAARQMLAKASTYDFEYVGPLGTKLFNDMDELLQWVVQRVLGIAAALDPNNVARDTGQLTLDWNGQCMHAYNNVAHDLRVNQNNDRTGYATGGIIEQNRFHTIGQIRHYDGIFRDNEVGNRAFLHQLVDPTVVPSAASARAINNDGANQGWYYGNVIYGSVDLDFHGHHHAPGFFAPQSHYHGSTKTVAYMQNAAGCTKTYNDVTASKAEGPHKDHGEDNDIHAFHINVVEQADTMGCLPHFDHGKRWTSVLFNDNLVIDPNGIGLRFDDRNHRADDEQANSENMKELKKPHYHQKWVQLERNTVVGKIFVDVLNAAGTDLWSDDWSAVQSAPGAARIQESLAHPGAEVVNSHPYRNDAWLDIRGNNILATQSAAILVADAADLTLFQLQDNRGFGFPKGYQANMAPEAFLEWLRSIPSKSTDQAWSEIQAFDGQDRGVQAMAQLSFLRNAFTVEHCGNDGRGLDRGLVARDRIFDDGASIIRACGTSDYLGANPQVDIVYTPAPATPVKCTEAWRDFTAGTDDFYVSETTFDVLDGLTPAAACDQFEAPAPPPDAGTLSDPVAYGEQTANAVVAYTTEKLGL